MDRSPSLLSMYFRKSQIVSSSSSTDSARLFSPSICGVYGLKSLAHVAPKVTLLLCKPSDISEWCLHIDNIFICKMRSNIGPQKRLRFKHQIRVTICGLHPKLGGLAGLLPAQSRRSTSSQQTATSSPLYPFSIMRLTSAFGKQESHTRTTAAIRASCSILSAAMSVFRDSVSFVANMRMAGPYTSRNTIC